jgi:hypothetical protein
VHGRPLARPNKAMHLAPSAQVIGALGRFLPMIANKEEQ